MAKTQHSPTSARRRAAMGACGMLLAVIALSCSRQTEISKEPGADAGPVTTTCPTPIHGPSLVMLPAADGSKYCMDARETTRGEYEAFLGAKVPASGQPPECAWNTQFNPQLYDPETQDTPPATPYCEYQQWNSIGSEAAVGCVDFCDAQEYCKWAGKRLCGRVGGSTKWGQVYDTKAASSAAWDTFLNTVAIGLDSEFVNACTQGGKTKFQYGDQYQPGACIDGTWLDAGKGAAVTDPDNRQCHGTTPPFDGVHDLNGSVVEWQNTCWIQEQSCVMAGSAPGKEGCVDYVRSFAMRELGPGIGFRCCADAVAAP